MYSNKRAKSERWKPVDPMLKNIEVPRQLCSRHREQLVQIGVGGEKGSKRDAFELKRKKRSL